MSSEDFAQMFEKSLVGKMDRLEVGQQFESEIVAITKEYVFIYVNGKSEGVIDLSEFVDDSGTHSLHVGDTISVHYLGYRQGEMRFTTKIAGEKANTELLEHAYKSQIPVEGVFEKEIKGGFEVKLGTVRAFCPFSQVSMQRVEDNASLIGKKETFRIIEYKDGGRSLTVSHRILEEEAKQNKIEALKTTLKEGAMTKGVVVSIQDYGAFIDLGGIQALLPISEMSRTRVDNIHDIVSVGQNLDVEILKLDWEKERISVSIKNQEADPWDTVTSRYPVGSKIQGKVVRSLGFGLFVQLEPGVDGLVHESLLKGDTMYGISHKSIKVGQTMRVEIVSVDAKNRRISLKPAKSAEDESVLDSYLKTDDPNNHGDTYNPFATLLKKTSKPKKD